MIVSMGLIVCDVLAYPVDKDVFDNDSIRLESIDILPGGDALNVAIGLSRYGNDVRLIGNIGNDSLGNAILQKLTNEAIDTQALKRVESMMTSTSLVLISKNGERNFAYYGKANDSLTDADITESMFVGAEHFHFGSAMGLPGVTPAGLERIMRLAKQKGLTTSMDMTYRQCDNWLAEIEPALPWIDYFLPSCYELERICGTDDAQNARAFFKQYGLKVLCIKRGAQGCYITDFDREYDIPSLVKGNVIDTTGAGDAFCAGFLSEYLRGADLYDSALFASASAAMCISEKGATQGLKSREDTWAYARMNTDCRI